MFQETVGAEKEKVPETKVTSLKAKSAVVPEESSGIQDPQQKIDALTTKVKSSTYGGAKPRQSNKGTTTQKNKDNGKGNQSPYKGQGPITSVAGPFRQRQKLYQCYNCGGGGIAFGNAQVQGVLNGGH